MLIPILPTSEGWKADGKEGHTDIQPGTRPEIEPSGGEAEILPTASTPPLSRQVLLLMREPGCSKPKLPWPTICCWVCGGFFTRTFALLYLEWNKRSWFCFRWNSCGLLANISRRRILLILVTLIGLWNTGSTCYLPEPVEVDRKVWTQEEWKNAGVRLQGHVFNELNPGWYLPDSASYGSSAGMHWLTLGSSNSYQATKRNTPLAVTSRPGTDPRKHWRLVVYRKHGREMAS